MDPNDLRDCVEREIKALIEPVAWERCEVVNKAEQESLRTVLENGARHDQPHQPPQPDADLVRLAEPSEGRRRAFAGRLHGRIRDRPAFQPSTRRSGVAIEPDRRDKHWSR